MAPRCAPRRASGSPRGSADVLVLSDELADGASAELVEHCAPPSSGKASILMLTRGGTAAAAFPNYPSTTRCAGRSPVSRVVERIESLIDERTLRDGGVLLTFGALTLDVANSRVVLRRIARRARPDRVAAARFLHGTARQGVFAGPAAAAAVARERARRATHRRRAHPAAACRARRLGCAGYIQTVRGSGYRFSRGC